MKEHIYSIYFLESILRPHSDHVDHIYIMVCIREINLFMKEK